MADSTVASLERRGSVPLCSILLNVHEAAAVALNGGPNESVERSSGTGGTLRRIFLAGGFLYLYRWIRSATRWRWIAAIRWRAFATGSISRKG